MNLSDSEIAASLLKDAGMIKTDDIAESDLILINTCSVRENAEQRIYKRIENIRHYKKRNSALQIGLIGCMAERQKSAALEKFEELTFVAGPDEYRSLPAMINIAARGERSVAVNLNVSETYEDVIPFRGDNLSAWLSIMRGCDRFCSYCVVPYVRGRERSRSRESIIEEVKSLRDSGYKEITLLGQNVNSYFDDEAKVRFPELLADCAKEAPNMRFRYATSHPADMSESLIATMAEFDNICKHVHLPLQSGSDRVLSLMNRKYSANQYMGKLYSIRDAMADCSITTDIIAGFPGESTEDFEATLSIMRNAKFDGAFMFKYSPRPGTRAYKLEDTLPEDVKILRLNEIIALQNSLSKKKNDAEIGLVREILVEGESKRSAKDYAGRTSQNKKVVFPNPEKKVKRGEFVEVEIIDATSATLFGKLK